jgi:restriction endonuclease S subunit
MRVKELCHIRSGYLIRKRVDYYSPGKVGIIQLKHLMANEIDYSSLECVDFVKEYKTLKNHILKDSDILISSRGSFNSALFDQGKCPVQVIASSPILVLTVKKEYQNILDPGYMVWLFNQDPAKNYFRAQAVGVQQLSLNKKNLGNYEIVLPSFEMQKDIVKFYNLSLKEKKLMDELEEQRKAFLLSIAQM